jgi:hypothetical protein
MTPLY